MNMKSKVREAFKKPLDRASTIRYSNKFCFCSSFGDGRLFLREPGDTTVIELNNVTGGRSSGIETASKVRVNIDIHSVCCCVWVK